MPAPTTSRVLAWAAVSAAGWLIALGVCLVVVANLESVTGLDHAIALGVHAALSTLLGGAVAVACATLILGGVPALRPISLAVLAAGAAVDGYLQLALSAWEIRRFGISEAELVGPTAVLFLPISALAVAVFAALLVPRRARTVPLVIAVACALVALGTAAANVGGLGNGLAADSVPLAIAVAVATIFAAVAPLLASLVGATDPYSGSPG